MPHTHTHAHTSSPCLCLFLSLSVLLSAHKHTQHTHTISLGCVRKGRHVSSGRAEGRSTSSRFQFPHRIHALQLQTSLRHAGLVVAPDHSRFDQRVRDQQRQCPVLLALCVKAGSWLGCGHAWADDCYCFRYTDGGATQPSTVIATLQLTSAFNWCLPFV